MARLTQQYDGLPEYDSDEYDSYQDFHEEEKAAMNELQEEADLIRFPVADGYAVYKVESIDPPVLQHVPFLDGYAIPAAHVRGLRSSDIESRIDFENNGLFGGGQ